MNSRSLTYKKSRKAVEYIAYKYNRTSVEYITYKDSRTEVKVYNTKIYGASRTSSISTFNCGFISEHLLFVQYKTKTKKFADFIIFFSRIFKILHK